MSHKEKHVSVLVLGDFGRSPRMQYHVLSLSQHCFSIDVIAYKGSDPIEPIMKSPCVHIHYMRDVPKFVESLPGTFRYFLKTLWQAVFLFFTLISISKMDCILLQNPPSIPTLPIACIICWIRKCKLMIDFHNYGYTLLGLSVGKNSKLVKIATWCEKYFSRKAQENICVTKAMKDDLLQNWGVSASVFYDRAPDIFHPISVDEKHSFFLKLSENYPEFQTVNRNEEGENTRFTKKSGQTCEMLNERPCLIVSSTSWTEDEDFSVLLSALEGYDHAANMNSDLPELVVAITGKGPLKSYYENEIRSKNFSHVQVTTLWLKSEDYPIFLACADLGISLHTSSSGLDLPMKVVDMFGCCLPVCAFAYKCIDELVKDGVNGTVFSNSQELSHKLQHLLVGFPKRKTDLSTFKYNLNKEKNFRWDENWNVTVYPLLERILC